MKQHYAIITDQRAEGSTESHEVREPANARQTAVQPARRSSSWHNSPVSETGVFPALALAAEGSDDSDRQDAPRTTSEIRTSPQPTTTPSILNGLTALIVEDTLELAEILQVTLQRMQIATAHESHVGRAVSRFNEIHPDVVLLDIGLPDGPGWKVLDSIKELQHGTGDKPPVVIVISAYGDAANRLVGKLHGVYSYLVKPFTPSEVESAVRSALSTVAG